MKRQAKQAFAILTGGLVILVVGVFLGIFILSMDADVETGEDWLTTEQLASFVEAVTRADLIDDPVELVSVEEITPSYVNGIDYFAEDIEQAFNQLYDISASPAAVVRNQDTVMEGSPTHSAQAPLSPVEFYSDPQVWEGMGDVIITHAEDHVSNFADSAMYKTLHEPMFWTDLGEVLVSDISEEYAEEELDGEEWEKLVHEKMADVIPILSSETTEIKEIEEVIDQYFEECWAEVDATALTSENSDNESPSSLRAEDDLVKAEGYPVSYRAAGRLFYKEALQPKEQLAYDVVMTAIQKGQFVVKCDFGVSADEMHNVVTAIRYDFPELFFLSLRIGYTGDVRIKEIEIVINEAYQKIGVDKALLEIAVRVKPVVAAASKLDTDIEKVKYIVDDMCGKISYPKVNWEDWDAARKIVSSRQDMWSAIVWNDTVCAGYSAAFHYYMRLLGIDATIVTSPVHRWNLLELDGDYYYMDVTSIDSSGDYGQFNFNEAKVAEIIARESMPKDAHQRVGDSTKLPAANGTKYYYYNWYGKDEPKPAKPEPVIVDGQSVILNGADISSRLTVADFEGVLYADGESFIEAIQSPGAGASEGWFRYHFTLEDDGDIRVTDNGGKPLFAIPLLSRQLMRDGKENIEMGEIIQYHDGVVYVPMRAFCEALSQMGYEVELVLNGVVYSFSPKAGTPRESQSDSDHTDSAQYVPSDESGKEYTHSEDSGTWNIPDWDVSAELIENWQDGPASLEEHMKPEEVIAGIAGTYAGYYAYTRYQNIIVFNEDNLTGTWEELDPALSPVAFNFNYMEAVDHPLLDDTYNGIIFVECEDGSSNELVVVSPTILYEPQFEAIFYKVK